MLLGANHEERYADLKSSSSLPIGSISGGLTSGKAQDSWDGQLSARVCTVVGDGVGGHITALVLLEVDESCSNIPAINRIRK